MQVPDQDLHCLAEKCLDTFASLKQVSHRDAVSRSDEKRTHSREITANSVLNMSAQNHRLPKQLVILKTTDT